MRAAEKSVMGLASCQLGVFTLAQARARGMTLNQVKRRLRAGRWSRVLPSVYAVEGAPDSWRRRLKAAALWSGPRCVFSHRTAAALWGLTRFVGEEGPAVIQREFKAATARVRPRPGLMENDRAILRVCGFEADAEGKRICSEDAFHARTGHIIVAAELKRVVCSVGRPVCRHEHRSVSQFGDVCGYGIGCGVIGDDIKGKVRHRPRKRHLRAAAPCFKFALRTIRDGIQL